MPATQKRSRRVRASGRNGRLLNVWVSEDQKVQLDELAEKTRVTRSELVRQALELLFDRAAGGQLQIGFPSPK